MLSNNLKEKLLDDNYEEEDSEDVATEASRQRSRRSSLSQDDTYIVGLPQMEKDHGEMFRGLTVVKKIDLGLENVNTIMTYDSKSVVCIASDVRIQTLKICSYNNTTAE